MNFEELRNLYIGRKLCKDTHLVDATRLREFPENKLVHLENISQNSYQMGLKLLAEGKLARLILNGGMATRFGGRVKGICEVYEGKTFLQLKLEHMTALEKKYRLPEIPIALMNSSATHELTVDFLSQHNKFGRQKISCFVQGDFPRLTAEGDLFSPVEDAKARAPRGHGDFLWSLDESETLDYWESLGITFIDFSNIDNLGATVEPALLGEFSLSGKLMSIDLAKKNPGDKGGAACLKDGVPGVLEGIYFDNTFDQDRLPYFNTNNLMFRLQALRELLSDKEFSLPWNVVEKEVDGEKIIQFERIAIDTVFGFNKKHTDDNVLFFAVPREGEHGRFYPVKSVEDLDLLKDKLKERLKTN